MNKITRSEAKELGLTRFFSVHPCKSNHHSERWTCNNVCVECYRIKVLSEKEKIAEYKKEYYLANKESIRIKGHKYYIDNKDKIISRCAKYQVRNRERTNNKNKIWKTLNKDKVSLTNKRYRLNNSDKVSLAAKAWSIKNRDKTRSYVINRRCRLKNAEGEHSLSDIKYIITKQKNKCANCRNSVKDNYHIDHIYPISKGGSNNKHNIQILCPTCNVTKNAKDPIIWAQENGRLL